MRILVITNTYPPFSRAWGYMQLCEEVMRGLHARGHAISVLTSTYRDEPDVAHPYPVHRLLTLDPDWYSTRSAMHQFFVGRRRRERQAINDLDQLIGEFRPDVISVWHYIGLPRALLQHAEHIDGVPVVYYLAGYHPELSDEYMAYWQAKATGSMRKLPKTLLAPIAMRVLEAEGKPVWLRYEHVACVSEYVRDRLVSKGLIAPGAAVIHNGVDIKSFAFESSVLPGFSTHGLRCLIAGEIKAEKGVGTAINAMARLAGRSDSNKVTLTVLGGGRPDYLTQLHDFVAMNHLEDVVTFHAPVPRDEMPGMFQQHNVLLLPTEYEEPLARSMQEAMAMGLLCIGTTTGGSGELLKHEQTGLAFPAGDADALADQLSRAGAEPDLAQRLARNGQKVVAERFTIDRTISQLESYFDSMIHP